jgi:hypothetical protein
MKFGRLSRVVPQDGASLTVFFSADTAEFVATGQGSLRDEPEEFQSLDANIVALCAR